MATTDRETDTPIFDTLRAEVDFDLHSVMYRERWTLKDANLKFEAYKTLVRAAKKSTRKMAK